ncbi:glycine dehydrogenase [Neomicrococcus aestuarii]|uniref:Glycine dehydrogenase (decarboxylating) n=1 Tax=Neomicrococcus aestuarii TaxID=556325 RepID=A0A7W8X0U8_9MICC|nr:aminomethyl-transferring glycine dehydrogenase [Neomicrococcus aestuarii]MBB5513228.1 glycine dehydrogenase [Neomicrococcus aestuarii]
MTLTPHISEFTIDQDFSARHIGPREDDVKRMLEVVGYSTLDELVDTAVPQGIRMEGDLQLPEARTEMQVLEDLRNYANQNVIKTQMIGQGFSGTLTPRIILRKVLENPAWYTAYTPYQPEISQGRLEALLNFQTAVQDLTGLPIANASMLDEASAVAEAVLLMRRANKKKEAGKTVIDQDVFPQNLAVVKGRAEALGFEVEVADLSQGLPEGDISGVVLQQPGDSGRIMDYKAIIDAAHERGALVTVAADILSLTLIKSPGEQGADIAVGNTQRLGVPLFFGGPHAAFFAVRDGLERQIPGRLVGVSKDDAGRPAYRLALQTREQHIRREKATSNICTAQALLAITASMYVVYHGPAGLKATAQRTHQRARALAALLAEQGIALASDTFFDTVRAKVPGRAQAITTAAEHQGVNIRLIDQDTVSVSTDELTSLEHIAAVAGAFGVQNAIEKVKAAAAAAREGDALGGQNRESDYLTHPIFNTIKSETQMLRYLRKLSDRDLALDRTMIPLGSCTMKLNAATEMESISWPGFADIHPFAPESQTAGWRALITDLESRLTAITGYAGVSIQPNAGSQGEYAGLLAIRQFHLSKGDSERDIVLIPASAHGTNAASAVLAGLRVVVVKTASDGTIDSADLDAKIAANEGKIAAIMITYPSTHGVYDADVTEVCRKVHEAGGQVYIDGANMNALVGLAQPGKFGGDVSHLNLHKTFCIPHGGGGPGVGPVAVAEHLVPFLPGAAAGPKNGREGTPVTATTYGSAGVLPISWAYVALMGAEGLREATKMALLNANYISKRLSEQFPTLYTGNKGLVAHECILDLRELTAKTGVTAEDVCKRLIDYGFHAPTLAFPVAGTLMVEPTESEDLGEIDRFIDAMIAIKAEMDQVLAGDFTVEESPLRNAPHTTRSLMHGEWDRKYTREQGAFPGNVDFTDKYFPPVGRIDGAFGDRNLVCECPPPEAFDETN